MDPRLYPLNAVLALTAGYGGWPTPLRDSGLRVHLIEAPANTERGQVVVDAVVMRDDDPLLLLIESKSGANIERSQAERYAVADATSLRRAGSLPRSWSEDQPALPCYACSEEHRARIELGLREAGLSTPVISIGPRGARSTDLALAGIPDFDVPCPYPPPGIVPVDGQSPVEEYVELLRPVIIGAMAQRAPYLDVRQAATKLLGWWPLISRGAQSVILRRVESALRRLATNDFKGSIRLEPSGGSFNARIAILETPETFDPRGRTQGYQRLQRRAIEASGRRPPQIEGQTSFDDLASEGGLETD